MAHANGKGFPYNQGPGKSTSNYDGGGHGGVGGDDKRNGGSGIGITYDSITAPGNLGSGGAVHPGSGTGGGAIALEISHQARIDGDLGADSVNSGVAAGAGGSIYLRCATLSGSGKISADGKGGSGYGGGGGGRVSVVLSETGADFSVFGGLISAYGGQGTGAREDGAAGTVYLETAAQGSGAGNLIIDNMDLDTHGGVNTLMPAGVNLNDFSEIIIRNKGNLAVDGDDTLDLGTAHITCEDRDNATLTIVEGNGVVFPASYTISGYTLAIDGNVSAIGNWTIASNGKLSHSENGTSETYKLNLSLTGDLTVQEGGLIDVTGMGFNPGVGLGATTGLLDGGSYGGIGGDNGPDLGIGTTYGNITAPGNIGSGGYNLDTSKKAGGAVRLVVSGTALVNGSIIASGDSGAGNGGASGGSLWITTGTLYGNGIIQSHGGNSSAYGGGGGGRIAVALSSPGADFSGFTGSIIAYGGDSGARQDGA
ncbi:MAG: hypothetical protein HQL31_03440, partial [Planctomycetes bacterium]|nr:hypothetical protein [Planctomycetota bacterium]